MRYGLNVFQRIISCRFETHALLPRIAMKLPSDHEYYKYAMLCK